MLLLQAATSQLESPMKKLDFGVGKENMPSSTDTSVEDVTVQKYEPAAKEVDMSLVGPGIKPEEMDEPLLIADPQRFVLFPIKYHEVCLPQNTHRVAPSALYA